MPTYARSQRFRRDYDSLTPEQRRAFKRAIRKFVTDLRRRRFRKGLRVKPVEGAEGQFEMTWASDGRAIFMYGAPVHPGETHVIWLRVGTHVIFDPR